MHDTEAPILTRNAPEPAVPAFQRSAETVVPTPAPQPADLAPAPPVDPRKAVEEAPSDAPLGLYLVGQVGRGKSMLMDLFFASADVARKQRLHFHQFMQQAHRRIHAWRKEHGDSAEGVLHERILSPKVVALRLTDQSTGSEK